MISMMKIKRLFFLCVLLLLVAASCGRTCRCYRYDGNVDEFDMDELSDRGTSCAAMEEMNYGLLYSLCERVS